jgi:hypothetical protein
MADPNPAWIIKRRRRIADRFLSRTFIAISQCDTAVIVCKGLSKSICGQSTGGHRVPTALPQLVGSFVSAGNISFQAGQIYPSTDTEFSIVSTDVTAATGTLSFSANGAPP